MSTQTPAADWPGLLPDVQLEVRLGGVRGSVYPLSDVDFLIGSVPGCDLRVPAGEAPAVICLLARHPGGAILRKLAPTQTVLINEVATSRAELADGDLVRVGKLEVQVRITAAVQIATPSLELRDAQRELQARAAQLRAQVLRFQEEKAAFDTERERTRTGESAEWQAQRTELMTELHNRESLLNERAAQFAKQEDELAKVRQEMTELRRQLYDHYQDRRDRLAAMQAEVERAKFDLQAREKKLRLEELDAADRGQRDRKRFDELEKRSAELTERMAQFDDERRRFEHERKVFEDASAAQTADFKEREAILADRLGSLDAKSRECEADVLRLTRMQAKLDERDEELKEQAMALSRQTEQWRADSAGLPEDRRELDALRIRLAEEAERLAAREADLHQRETVVAERTRDLDGRLKQYEADVLRLTRLEGQLEARDAEHKQQADELTRRREQLKADSAELEQQLRQADELRVKLADDEERLREQSQKHDFLARQLAERSAALEGQQATLTMLRSRVERMREEVRAREQHLDQQRTAQDAREAELSRKNQEALELLANMESERRQHALDREQWLQRGAVMDAAVRQLKQAQEQLAAEEQRVRQEAADVAARGQRLLDSDAILQGRLTQLGETQERLELERQTLRDRAAKLVEREQACEALQEQVRRRSDEITQRHQEIGDRLQDYQAKFAELDARQQALDERERRMQAELDTRNREIEQKAEAVRKQHAEVAGFEDKHTEQMNHLAVQRRSHADERAQFLLEQQATLDRLVAARSEIETLRAETHALIGQLPDAELRAGTALDRLGNAREQMRGHLGEIHQYVRQCQEEMEQLRARLQQDLDKLHHEEQALRQSQDEHRLAVTAFRQQLIDWQGQISELKRLLARDQTRLERKQAQTDERARAVEEQSQQLSQHAEALHEQERAVADRRLEIDHHLAEMRDWYRRKLRELAGIPLTADGVGDAPPTILPLPAKSAPQEITTEDGEVGIVPTIRSILSLAGPVETGDQKLGKVLADLQLIDNDTLTALLAESRRQRRSLRQVLLASGVITLYQLALIEAGNVQGLMLGPVRVIDRLRTNTHETVYRIFDPRRGTEAVLRHLSEADMTDAVRPDEFRQRFAQTMLNDPHLANTLEVMELLGRPAAVQEWLSGLPATDWPPLAAAPGVCYRLLTQAAQGLATAHHAGVIHGHLSDAHLLLTGEGVLKIRGLGEPPWLSGAQHDEEPTMRGDLQALGRIASGWCTPTGVRRGPKTKPLPDALVSVLYRLASPPSPSASGAGGEGESDPGYRDVGELLADLQAAAPAIPANAEAWDRLLKYVREHGTTDAMLRQSA